MSNAIQVIFPYRSKRGWMFDDNTKKLYREPFVCGIPEVLEALGSDDANSLAHHDDPVFDPIQWRLEELRPFFPVLVPDLDYAIKGIVIPKSVTARAMELLRQRREAQHPDTPV